MRLFGKQIVLICLVSLLVSGCGESVWNNPHVAQNQDVKVMYSNFTLRPKYLDPARSFSSEESDFIDQIYEPPLQYNYLKRPYELEPSTITRMPTLTYQDQNGEPLPADASNPAYSVYWFELKRGIQYQPHPAFAKNDNGERVYDFNTHEEGESFQTLKDFTQSGTKELIADDYIYQIKRIADPKRSAPLRGLLSQYIDGMSELTEEITEVRKNLGEHEWLDLRTLKMRGLTKLDDHHFTIRLKGKYPQFTYWLAFHFFAPIPWQVDYFYHLPGLPERNITLQWHPVGTGAYMMTENNPNAQIVLERNPNFHHQAYPSEGEGSDVSNGLLEAKGKKLPFIDKYVFRLEKEAIPTWTKFLQGYYDRSGISRDSFDQAVSVQAAGIGLSDEMIEKDISMQQVVTPSTYYMGFNMLDSVVGGYSEKARKLRQAIAIAYDTDEYIKIFLNGRGQTGMSPIPPGIFGFQEGEKGLLDTVFEWQEQQAKRKSVNDARRLLAEAGYPEGRNEETGEPLVLNLDTTSGSTSKAQLSWMAKQFKKLGIQLNVRATDYNRFKGKMETGNAQLYFWGWLADYPDPENFLFLLYGPNAQVDSKSGVNSANYKNTDYDRLFEKMRQLPNNQQRADIIQKMMSILAQDSPWGMIYHAYEYNLSHGWVSNFKPHGISKANLKYYDIDTKKRQEMQAMWNKPVIWPLLLVFIITITLIVPGYLTYQRRQQRTIGD